MHLIETNDFINLPESRIDSTSHALIARYPYRVTLAKKEPERRNFHELRRAMEVAPGK